MSLVIIAAVSSNDVIGNSKLTTMPWKCSEELKHFKRETLGNVVVMGRVTAEQVGPLPERECIVLSRDLNYQLDGFITMTEEALLNETDFNPDVWYFICGGAKVYESFIPYSDTFIISTMKFEAEGDVLMPTISRNLRNYKIEEFEEFDVNYYVAV